MAIDSNFKTGITDAVKSLTEARKLTIRDAIYAGVREIQDFSDRFNVLTDIRNGELVPIITTGNNYGALSASIGDCSMNECELTDTYSTKKWLLGNYNCRMPLCINTLSEDFRLFWGMYNQNLQDPLKEPDKKAFVSYIIYKAKQNIQGALWRTSHWGDVTSANDLISKNNGFWTEAEAGDGVKLPMTLTAGELTGEEIYNYLSDAYNRAGDEDWFDFNELEWRMSNKMARKLITWLNNLSDRSAYNCDCIDPNKIIGNRVFSIDNLTVFGIPVKAYKESDDSGKAVGQDPDYRALLIKRSNILVGTETKNHLDQFNIFYDQKDLKIYVDMAIEIGASIPLDEYVYLTGVTTP